MHYRSRIYNAFYDMFLEKGYEFHVVSNEYQHVDFPIRYKKHERSFSYSEYKGIISDIKPDVCISFLHLKDKIFLPVILYCRFKRIPIIYWGHGVNNSDSDNYLKNSLFKIIHSLCNALILYSPEQLKFVSKKNRKKTFIAKNTLDFSDVDLSKLRIPSEVKKVYGIKEKKIVLYISRILPYKKLNVLLDILQSQKDVGLVVVGGGIDEQQRKIIDENDNFYYLGEKYGSAVDEIYQMGDVFSTPGHIGLALNQAMFWGKPVVLLKGNHAPEIIYLKNGYNGYVCDTEKELKQTILKLCSDDELLLRLSANARLTFEKEMGIENMFQGFMNAIDYCL